MPKNSVTINLISHEILLTILSIYKKNPQWLKNEYQKYSWLDENTQLKFTTKLVEKLSNYCHQDQVFNYVIVFFNSIVDLKFFQSKEWLNLMFKVNLFFAQNLFISALLLDVENIRLTEEIEKILESVAQYPLSIKFAFANWKKQGKKDLNLHERSYQLIHVPQGKNNADFKMIEFGKFIVSQNLNIKEIFVVSSDRDLDDFCTFLINKNFILYRVTRQLNTLSIFNSKIEKTSYYSLNSMNENISLQELILNVKHIIKEEQIRRGKVWIKLLRVRQLFELKYKQDLKTLLSYHFPDEKNPWLVMKHDFVFHNVDNHNHVYLSIFDGKISPDIVPKYQAENKITKIQPSTLNTPEDLEEAIYEVISYLLSESEGDFVILSKVATKFNTQNRISLTKVINKLKIKKKLSELIQSYPKITVQKCKSNYQIRFKK